MREASVYISGVMIERCNFDLLRVVISDLKRELGVSDDDKYMVYVTMRTDESEVPEDLDA